MVRAPFRFDQVAHRRPCRIADLKRNMAEYSVDSVMFVSPKDSGTSGADPSNRSSFRKNG